MIKILIGILLVWSFSIPTEASEIIAPSVPNSGLERMPQNVDSFGDSLLELIQNSIQFLPQELEEAIEISAGFLFSALLFSVLLIFAAKASTVITIAGVSLLSTVMFRHTGSMIDYASDTVFEICEYGKLLCPVMTTALAAQGGITTSAALYTGTTVFISLLTMMVSGLFIPMVNLYLLFSVSYCALGEESMKRFADVIKNFLSWLMKTMLIVFTTYMSVTGVVSGTTDAAALKATKVTISSVVPVVGGILSDVSESVLISMEMMKNTAGIYGILAVLAVFMGPFLKVGSQYLVMKATAAFCEIFGNKKITALMDAFSTAMGLLLAMVGSGCLMVLIGTVCFLKGIG